MKTKNFQGRIIRDRFKSGKAQRWWNYQMDRLRAYDRLISGKITGDQFSVIVQKLIKKYNPFN